MTTTDSAIDLTSPPNLYLYLNYANHSDENKMDFNNTNNFNINKTTNAHINLSQPLPTPIIATHTTSNKPVQLSKNVNPLGKDKRLRTAVRIAAEKGLQAMIDLYERKEPSLLRKGNRFSVFFSYAL